jgi:site-specific DNA recombinase
MPSTNGHGPKRTILYARVSTDEQARSGYSLAQQIEALREYAAREGYEVLEEVADPGQSGASLERPGMDRVRDLVAAGGVSVVLAQDRDRFAREPAYHYLLRREFEEHGTKIRALNDRGDETPEGELTDGILDQLAKYERAKIAERTRRGKVRKAREGKVGAGGRVKYGFKLNATRDGFEVDEEQMAVVRRIFHMIGLEGLSQKAIYKNFEREDMPTPGGGKHWDRSFFRKCILEDAYKPHSYEEVARLVSPEVASRLDKEARYGIWWFNRRRVIKRQVSEAAESGRRYRTEVKSATRPKEDWIAIPVPDSGIPREVVDAARAAIKNNRAPSVAGRRFWELSGGIVRCGACSGGMDNRTMINKVKGVAYFYNKCRKNHFHGDAACLNRKNHRAKELEADVWHFVSGLLRDPERLRQGLAEMMQQERAAMRGDPDQQAKRWLEKLSEVDQERRGYLRLAAKGLMTDEDLEESLGELEETRKTAERELESLRERREAIEQLERDRDALLEHYAKMVPKALAQLTGKERHKIYRMLRLEVYKFPNGDTEIRGLLGEGVLYPQGNAFQETAPLRALDLPRGRGALRQGRCRRRGVRPGEAVARPPAWVLCIMPAVAAP